jgi:hypothetical protein
MTGTKWIYAIGTGLVLIMGLYVASYFYFRVNLGKGTFTMRYSDGFIGDCWRVVHRPARYIDRKFNLEVFDTGGTKRSTDFPGPE